MYYSLSDVISNSLKLAWKHKILWVLALMLGVGSSFRGGGGGNDSSTNNQYEYPNSTETRNLPESIPQNRYNLENKTTQDISKIATVLGLNTTQLPLDGPPDPLENTSDANPDYLSPESIWIQDLFATLNEPLIFKTHLILGVLALTLSILFALFVNLFVSSWASGAFYKGIDDAIRTDTLNLSELGTYGRKSFKKLFKYRLFISFAGLLFLFTLVGMGVGFLLQQGNITTIVFQISVILLLCMVPIIFLILLVVVVEKFSLRYMILKDTPIWESIKSGWKLLLNNIVKYVIQAVANCFVTFLMSLGVVLVVGGAALGTLVLGTVSEGDLAIAVYIGLALLATPLLFALIGFLMAFGGFLSTFKEFTWGMFFNFATEDGGYKIKDGPSQSVNLQAQHPDQNKQVSEVSNG